MAVKRARILALGGLCCALIGCSLITDPSSFESDADGGVRDADDPSDVRGDVSGDVPADVIGIDVPLVDAGGCIVVDDFSMRPPVVRFERAAMTIGDGPFEKVQVLPMSDGFYVSRRLPRNDYELARISIEGAEGPPLDLGSFLRDVAVLDPTCLEGEELLDLHMQETGAGFAVAAVSPGMGAGSYVLRHIAPDGRCTDKTHTGIAEGFVRANAINAVTRAGNPAPTQVAHVDRDDPDGYMSVFGQDAMDRIHVVLNRDADNSNVDIQANGRPVVDRQPVGELDAPPVIVPVGSEWIVLYGIDEDLVGDVVSTSLVPRHIPDDAPPRIGRVFGAAARDDSGKVLVVAQHPTLPARAEFLVLDATTGMGAMVFQHDMPHEIRAIDVAVDSSGVFAVAIDSATDTSRMTRALMAAPCD